MRRSGLARPSRKALAEWDRLREEFGGPDGNDGDYIDPLHAEDWLRPLCFAHTASAPQALYYFTKEAAAYAIATRYKAALPSRASFILRAGVAPALYAEAVRREAERCRCRVRFVGDLDPQDLAIYLSLVFGDYGMRPHPRSAVPVVYVGINDTWLTAAERAFPSDTPWLTFLDFAALAMTPDERRYLAVIEKLAPPLETWGRATMRGLAA